MRVTPINMAEAVIEPFWDPVLSGLPQWRVEPGNDHGLSVYQGWCWVSFEWTRRPVAGPALRMHRRAEVNCADYDDLIVSLAAPDRCVVRVRAETDKGVAAYESSPDASGRKEHVVDLRGASRLGSLTLEIEALEDGALCGWFNWIGLCHRARL